MYRAGFPDLRFEPQQFFSNGDTVAVYFRSTGTHSGEFMGMPATGKSIDVRDVPGDLAWGRRTPGARRRPAGVVHVLRGAAEPLRALLGRRRSAKTDRLDARWLARLVAKEMLPESWIPPEEVQQLRDRTRLHKALAEDRRR